jgi:dipeptidyl aminopeptidase/acylaminoacyl peptidase
MPIVGPALTKNDTFVKQVVDSAQAAIDKAVELGVTDRDRVGVGGHSYGAFMTANLLAHSDIFRAGVARSGAYNRTLTPFGFQDEERNFWEATKIYTDVSPFFYANKINEPILLIHGEADNNQGHVSDPIGTPVCRDPGQRRHRKARDAAIRGSRLLG